MYEVISLHDKVRWQEILEMMQVTDVYYSTQYFNTALKLDPGEALLFYYTDAEGEVAYPFIKRSIAGNPEGYYDISTPFGYGGPIIKNRQNSQALISRFREEFCSFCQEQRIIAEFIRFHPLQGNALPFKGHLKLLPMYNTYTKKLELDDLLKESLGNQDVIIKKLGTVRHMFEFLVLYYSEVRQRDDADSYYFFTDDYFEALVKELGPHVHLFGAYLEDRLVTACYVLGMDQILYHHLDGSLQGEKFSKARMALLLKVAEWGAENHFAFYHLGTDYKGDIQTTERIKGALANLEPELYYIGEKIHDAKVYGELIDTEEMDTAKRYRNV